MERRDFVRHTAVAGAALTLHPRWAVGVGASQVAGPAGVDFSRGWRFHLGDATGAEAPAFDDGAWGAATLPPTAHVERLVTGAPGTDGYPSGKGRAGTGKTLTLDRDAVGAPSS